MIEHYLKVAFRNLVKYKTQTFISIIGLSVGFTCFALSVLWIRYEMTYDTFHEGAERIYLAGNSFRLVGDGFSQNSSTLLADYLLKNCPEVEKACHIKYNYGSNVKYEGAEFAMFQLKVDSGFISMFNITVLSGGSCLRLDKRQIAITEKTARKIFGEEDPIGKRLVFPNENNTEMTIVAVVESWKGHSQFPFDILLPYYDSEPHWGRQQCHTLFRVYPGSDINALEQRLAKYEVQQDTHRISMSTPIALLSTLRSTHPGNDINVKLEHIRLFAIIGALVIVCGLCNYLTMLITRIRMRKRELALRKVNGASNGSLLALLLSELISLLAISFGGGIMLVELILPAFKRISQIDENSPFFYKEVMAYMVSLIVITIGIATLLIKYVSKQNLLNSINHKIRLHFSSWFYKSSILFQLFISVGFVFCTLVMMKQLNCLLNTKELGLDRHNVGVITYGPGLANVPVENILDQMPEVIKRLHGFYTPVPKQLFSTLRVNDWDDKVSEEQYINIEDEAINEDYVDFFGIELLEGEMLSEKDGEETVVINEAAVKAFGWEQPIGKKFRDYTVKGVIKDICYNAPIHPVAPAMFSYSKGNERKHIIFRVQEGDWNVVVKKLEEEIGKVNTDSYTLLNMDKVYDDYMKSEETLSKLLGIVSCVCILIAVFGIFSLVTLSCQQRRKEIAIRKVNGANIRIILNLFFKEYLFLLVIASCIAFPLGYVIMKHWLEGYVKQTSISLGIYSGIFIAMLIIIFLSIIWRVWKAARQNPAEVIKSE